MDMDKDGGGFLVEDLRAAEPGTAAPAYELKVLGGRHAGAVMPLGRGSHSLGQDEECDLIFLDDAFLNGRVIVDLTGDAPRLSTTGEVKASLEGKPVEGEVALKPYQAVEVGATRFALGLAGEPWPEPPKPAPAPAGDVPDGAPAGAAPSEPAATDAESDAKAAPAKARGRRLGAFAVGGAALALAATALVMALQPKPDRLGEAKGVVASMALSEIEVSESARGLEVTGFVRTEAEKATLAERLLPIGLPVEAQVLSAEEIAASIREVLDMHHLAYAVEIGKQGKALLLGVDDDSVRVREIVEAVRQGAQAGVTIEARIQGTAAVQIYLTRLLAAKGLVHKVKIEADRGRLHGVLVTGKMDDAELAAWGTIKASFRSHFGFDVVDRWTERLSPTLQQFAAAVKELDEGLLGVTPGEMAYISLKGGRKCFEGGRLRSGPYVQSIHPDRLVLSIGSVQEIYTLRKGRR